MKKILIFFIVFVLSCSPAFALFNEKLETLDKEEISKLTNDGLIKAYENIVIEKKAREIFYFKAGMTPKEFNELKSILKEIIDLREEINRRELKVSDYEEILK